MAYTKLTLETQNLIAYTTIKSGFDSLAKRADRVVKPLGTSVYDRLIKRQKISKESGIIANYRFEDKDKARTLSEGIKEFKERFPEYGIKLQNVINETRKTKRRYLQFGVEPGYEIPEENYIGALTKIGIPSQNLARTFETVMEISDLLASKKEEGLTEMLIK